MSALHFIFPADPFNPTSADEIFAEQRSAFHEMGFSTSLLPESVIAHGKRLRHVPPGSTVVYRGWMLNADEYSRLCSAIEAASSVPFTPLNSYLAAHHLPNWYPLISEFTPETRVLATTADLEAELRSIGWTEYFVKDYVKSLKTSRGSLIHDPTEIGKLVSEMQRFRGEIEGGICVRRVEAFVADSERRHFVIDKKVFTPDGDAPPEIALKAAERIPSRFFSIDVIRREDGIQRIVEVGDGQVSDLVGWSTPAFAAIWNSHRAGR